MVSWGDRYTALRVAASARLYQAVGLFAPGELHRAVECDAIKPLLVDIAHEIARCDRRVCLTSSSSSIGPNSVVSTTFTRSGKGAGGGRSPFCRHCSGKGDQERQRRKDESAVHNLSDTPKP